MRKAGSLFFAVAATLLICSPIAYRIAMESPAPFAEISNKSWLEGRPLVGIDDFEGSSFFDSTFQGNVENLANDSVPARDELMIGSAYLQKFGIDTAAIPFGFDLRHSYLGSDYVVDHADKVILHEPAKVLSSGDQKKRLDDFIETINESARSHPDTRFVVDQVMMPDQTEESPLYSLASEKNLVDSSYVQEFIVDRFDDSVTAFCDPIESYDEIESEWFASDHHWSLKRAVRSYNMIADCLDLAPFEYDEAKSVEISDSWFGSNARSSRNFDCPDTLNDIPTDYSHLEFFALNEKAQKKKRVDSGSREMILSGQSVSLNEDNGGTEGVRSYTGYYGMNPVFIMNMGSNNGKTCLLVGDSFSHCLKRIIANNYKNTLVILPANENCEVNSSLDSIIDKHEVDDVIVLTHCQKYNELGIRSPVFVGA